MTTSYTSIKADLSDSKVVYPRGYRHCGTQTDGLGAGTGTETSHRMVQNLEPVADIEDVPDLVSDFGSEVESEVSFTGAFKKTFTAKRGGSRKDKSKEGQEERGRKWW